VRSWAVVPPSFVCRARRGDRRRREGRKRRGGKEVAEQSLSTGQ
jgi:hypothetical protein